MQNEQGPPPDKSPPSLAPTKNNETLRLAFSMLERAQARGDAKDIREAEIALEHEKLAAQERRRNAMMVGIVVLVLVLVLGGVAGVAGAVHIGAIQIGTQPANGQPANLPGATP